MAGLTATRGGKGLDRDSLISIEPLHVEQIRQELGEVAPDLRAKFDREIRGTLREVAGEAAGRIGGSGRSAGAYRVKRRGAGWTLANRERGAVITEFAGSVNPGGKTPRGATLIRTLSARYGAPGRIAWAAWDAKAAAVDAKLREIVATTEAELDRRLGRV